jgi:hypothetical protein
VWRRASVVVLIAGCAACGGGTPAVDPRPELLGEEHVGMLRSSCDRWAVAAIEPQRIRVRDELDEGVQTSVIEARVIAAFHADLGHDLDAAQHVEERRPLEPGQHYVVLLCTPRGTTGWQVVAYARSRAEEAAASAESTAAEIAVRTGEVEAED